MDKKSRRVIYFIPLLFAVIAFPVFAHPGRTDGAGGHTNHSTGDYHYHHGYEAHRHYDIDGDGIVDCPYDFKRATIQKDRNYGNSINSFSKERQSKSETKGMGLAVVALSVPFLLYLLPLIIGIYDIVRGLINNLKKRH